MRLSRRNRKLYIVRHKLKVGTTPADPDLARLSSAWPALSDYIKAAILALGGPPMELDNS
jgi:hypothetical protein